MTLGLWLTEDHLSDIDPLIRFFNYERKYLDGTYQPDQKQNM